MLSRVSRAQARTRSVLVATTALVAAALCAMPAAAQDWNGGSGDWNTAANWTPATVPDSNSAVANILVGGPGTVLYSATVTINQLNIGGDYTLAGAAATGIIMDGVNPAINNAASNATVTARFLLAADTTINFTAGGTLALNGQMFPTTNSNVTVTVNTTQAATLGQEMFDAAPGVLSLTKIGGDTLTLTNPGNTYTGATTVSAGTLVIATGAALSGTSGTTVASGATLSNDGTLANTVTVSAGGTFTNTANGVVQGLTTNEGTLTNDGTLTTLTHDLGTTTNNGTVTGDTIINADGATNAVGGTMAQVTVNAPATFANAGTAASAVVMGGTFNNSGSVTGNISIDGGAFNNLAGATVGGDAAVTSGTLTNDALISGTVTVAAAGTFLNNATGTAGAVISSGTVTNAGSVSSMTTSGGTTTNTGTITGAATVTGGAFTSTSVLGGNLTASGGTATVEGTVGGVVSSTAGGTVTFSGTTTGIDSFNTVGTTNVNAGTVTLDASGTVTNTGGFTIAAGSTLEGPGASFANNGGGTVTVASTGTLDTDLSNAGTAQLSGAIGGALSTSGTTTFNTGATVAGTYAQVGGTTTVAGDTTVTGAASMTNGALALSAGQTLTTTNNLAASGGASLNLDGTLAGDLSTAGAAALDLDGTVTGTLTNTSSAAQTVSGAVTGGLVQNAANAATEIDGATTLGGVNNMAGTVTVSGATTLTGAATNTGTMIVAADVAGNQAVTNSGTFITRGARQLTGTFASTQIVGEVNSTLGDNLTVTGDAQFAGNIRLDLDETLGVSGGADTITVGGNATGNVTVDITSFNGVALGVDVDVITAAGANGTAGLTASLGNLSNTGVFFFDLTNTGSAINLKRITNPGVGALAANISATQGVISSVVNRPSSALVTPLVNPGDNPCAIGTWARGTGGRATAQIDATSATSNVTNEVDLNYRGLQLGLDRNCSDGHFNGWDLAYGAFLGQNGGQSKTPLTVGATSTITTDFSQLFGGAYLSFARGSVSGDVQLRTDQTEYDISEDLGFGAGGLGIQSQTIESRGKTLSGTLSYSYTLNAQSGLRLVPTVGFSFSNISTDKVKVAGNPNSGADDAVISIEDINQRLGFLGATLARAQVDPDGQAATTYFLTGTYFNDFGDSIDSTVTAPGLTDTVTSDTLGSFGEVSVGLNRTTILDGGSALPARQLDANVRADTRFSESLDSWGLTAQFRLQF